jgi:lysophospholipase L1-like esterase
LSPDRWTDKAAARWLLALGVLLLALAGAELFLRAYSALSWHGSIEDLHQNFQLPAPGRKATLGQMVRPSPNERLVYELKPGLDVIFRGVAVRTNQRGWREGPVEASPRAETVRILGLGDSTMFGWGVAEEQRYMDLLEDRLVSERPGIGWETIVTAVPGYNLMIELESLNYSGAALGPDLIVYGWDPNDQCLPHFLLERKGFFEGPSPLAELFRGAGALPSRPPKLRSKERLGARCLGESVPERYRPVAGREPFVAALESLARFSAENDVPVVLLSGFGFDFESAMALPVPPGLLEVEAASRAGSRTEREMVLSRSDPHPNPLGHRLLADALFEELDALRVWEELDPTEESRP